jgi:hypothetical protein
MWQQRQNRRQRTLRPRRAPWQVHNQSGSPRPAHRAAQRGKRRMQEPIGAHPFRQSVDHPFTDHPGSLWCHVAGGQPGPSSSHDQICALCITSQRRGNQIQFIGQYLRCNQTRFGSLQQLTDNRPGEVSLLPAPAAVADSQHNRPNIEKRTLSHVLSLRGLPPGFRNFGSTASSP